MAGAASAEAGRSSGNGAASSMPSLPSGSSIRGPASPCSPSPRTPLARPLRGRAPRAPECRARGHPDRWPAPRVPRGRPRRRRRAAAEGRRARALGAARGAADLCNGRRSLLQSQVGRSFLWACCNGNGGRSDTILTWHIATSILEVRHPASSSSSISDHHHKIAATHMSRYCTYLMTWSPDLLPDEVAWSKGLYEDVKADAVRVIAGTTAGRRRRRRLTTPEAEYKELVKLLKEGSNHSVLRNGMWLGKQLVELADGEETAWAILAGFWAEMVLYVAPSENLKGHKTRLGREGGGGLRPDP